jgi:hypothetical protein
VQLCHGPRRAVGQAELQEREVAGHQGLVEAS